MNTLDGHKAFPYVAWTLIILFAAFTFYLTNNLIATAEQLDPNYGVVNVQY